MPHMQGGRDGRVGEGVSFTDDDLKRVKKACSQLNGPVGINGAYVLPLLARLDAAERYRDCAKKLLEVMVSYKRYTPEPYKQNPIYIMGSTEAEQEFVNCEEAWRKETGK